MFLHCSCTDRLSLLFALERLKRVGRVGEYDLYICCVSVVSCKRMARTKKDRKKLPTMRVMPWKRVNSAVRKLCNEPVWVRQYRRFVAHQPVVEERIEVNADGNVRVGAGSACGF